jgi:transposase-like protein
MSEEQVSAGPRRRTAEEAAQLVAEYEASRLSKHEFCRTHGLAISTLDAYRSGRRLGVAKRGTSPPRWVAVEVQDAPPQTTAAGSGLAVVLAQGRRIEVRRGFDAATLAQLLPVLERG